MSLKRSVMWPNLRESVRPRVYKRLMLAWLLFGIGVCSKPNQPNRKTANQTNPSRNRKKPHLVWLNSDDFCTEPHGSVWFAVCISATKPNRKNNEYYFKHVLVQLHSPRIISFDSIFQLLHHQVRF
jgi:hypothetical protein